MGKKWLIDGIMQLIVMERHGSLVEIVSLIGGDGIAQKRGVGVAYYSIVATLTITVKIKPCSLHFLGSVLSPHGRSS